MVRKVPSEQQISAARAVLFETIPRDDVLGYYLRSEGNEIGKGGFASPDSSAALVANTFGFFLNRPSALPQLPDWRMPWRPRSVEPEIELRFPWNGGKHPWLDVVIETDEHLVGIESKRFEPYRNKGKRDDTPFSDAYWRSVWGDDMKPYERMRDVLRDDPRHFAYINAVQLVKHAFGLFSQGYRSRNRPRRTPVLAYVYAEPSNCPPEVSRHFTAADREKHADEVRAFAKAVEGAAVSFIAFSYSTLLATFMSSPLPDVRAHAVAIAARYGC